jgi:Ser/Thr protein kinase RdoA (MazF antagonist)
MDRDRAREVFTPGARQALKSFPVEPGSLELVSLSENATFRVTDARDGSDYVLRLHRPGYHNLAELKSERMWTKALAGAGIGVPIGLSARDGRDYVGVEVAALGQRRFAGMARWTPGELLATVLARTEDVGRSGLMVEQLGQIAAGLHNQSNAWRPPPAFRRHALDTEGLMGEAPFWGRFWDHPALSPAERELMLEARARITAALERFGRRPSTYGVIHADLHPYNVLIDDRDRLTVIDFDDTAFGWHVYDLAIALLHYEGRADFAALESAFLRGYRAGRDLSETDAALIPMFQLIRRLAIIGWLHQRPEIDRSAVFDQMKAEVCDRCARFEPPG